MKVARGGGGGGRGGKLSCADCWLEWATDEGTLGEGKGEGQGDGEERVSRVVLFMDGWMRPPWGKDRGRGKRRKKKEG